MKKIIYKLSLLILVCTFILNAQTLFIEDNIDFTGNLSDNGWTAHTGVGNNPLNTTTGLTYIGYPSSGIGNAANIDADGEDVHRTFTGQSSGSVYASFLINVISTGTTYFLHLGNDPIGSTFRARVFIISDGTGDFEIGLSQSSGSSQGTTNNDYSFNTTYLLVLKYRFISGTGNDEASLFIFDNGVPNSELGTPTLGPFTGADISGIASLALRQASGFPSLVVDGVRISNDWSLAPLPVELSSFSAVIVDGNIKLSWRTETEVNNYGFDILRQAQDDEWVTIGFVDGYGNSNSPKEYQYIDDAAVSGKYAYRLKQIDNDGTFEYSKVIEVDMNAPIGFLLSQNYPNPFNPETTIKFNIAKAGLVKLSFYNILGELKGTIVNEFKDAGIHTVNINASELSSGIYIYKLEIEDFVQMRKMTLIK